MTLKIETRAIDELGDSSAPRGSRPWLLYVANEIRKAFYDTQQTGRRLEDLVHTFKDFQGWQEFGYLTWEQYCVDRLQARADQIETKARADVAAMAKEVKPLNGQGRPEKNEKHYNNNVFQSEIQGTDAAYLTSRIARDRPDILDRMKAGEYKSVRSAAIDAGIIDPDKTKRYSLPVDPVKAALYLRKQVDEGWIATFVAELAKGA